MYSCFPENEAPAVFLYSVMLVGSGDCKQVNGPDPPLCIGVLSGPLHCPAPPPGTVPGGGHSGVVLTTVRCSAVEGLVHSPAYSHQTLTNITLYKNTAGASFSGKQLYTCTISGQRTSVCRLRVSDRYKPHAVDEYYLYSR